MHYQQAWVSSTSWSLCNHVLSEQDSVCGRVLSPVATCAAMFCQVLELCTAANWGTTPTALFISYVGIHCHLLPTPPAYLGVRPRQSQRRVNTGHHLWLGCLKWQVRLDQYSILISEQASKQTGTRMGKMPAITRNLSLGFQYSYKSQTLWHM